MRRRLILAVLVAATVTACHRTPDDPAAAGADEQRQLNEAAASLDAQQNGAGNSR